MTTDTAQRILAGLPDLHWVTRIEFLDKGYSYDRKYILYMGERPRYLLRLSDIDQIERKQGEFDLLRRLHGNGVPCSQPVVFGSREDAGVCFMVLSYIEGDCMEDAIASLSVDDQYALGVETGRELRRLHSTADAPSLDWYDYMTRKYERRRATASKFGLTFRGQTEIESSIECSLDRMKGRPIALLHDDYHPGNLIVHDGRLAGIIDFNRYEWGDPVHDFHKASLFTAAQSPALATGQVDGYHDGQFPDGFWRLHNLYVAMVLHGDLAWTATHYPEHIEGSRHRVEQMIKTHDLVGDDPPTWYGPEGTGK